MLGPDDPAQVRTLMAQSLAALAQGDHAQRADAALAAADVLERHLGPADRSVLMCVELAAVVLAHNGQAERAIEVGERALRIREQTPEHLRDPILEGGALRYQAFYLTLAGRYEQAAPYWRRARDAMLPVTGRNHHAIALIDAGLSLCMPMPEQLAEADRLTARAMTIADASPAIAPDQRAAVHLARARVLIRQGEHEQALRLLAQAWNEWIYKAMPRFEWRRLALADARQAATALGRDDLLTAWDDAAESNSPTAPMP
jgi:tetratricopeptide (TPR) repeat protein